MYKYFLALKYLLSRPINLIGTTGIALAVWALVVIVSIFSGYLFELRAHFRAASSDIAVYDVSMRTSFETIERFLLEDPAVVAAAPRLTWYGLIDSESASSADGEPENSFFQVIGIDAEQEPAVGGFSEWLEDVEEPGLRVRDASTPFLVSATPDGAALPGVLIGSVRAAHSAMKRGETVYLSSGRQERDQAGTNMRPIHARFEVVGAFSSKHFEFDNATAFVDIGALRAILGHSPGQARDYFNETVAKLEHGSDPRVVRERLQERVREAKLPLAVITWEERAGKMLENVDHQRGLMKLVLLVLMIVAAFLVFATLLMMVGEKRKDIGILSALGSTRRGILSIFVLCGMANAFIGVGIGTGASLYTCYHLNDVNDWLSERFDLTLFPTDIYGFKEVPYALEPAWIAQVGLGAVLLTLVFSVWPAWRAARLDPVRALRDA